MKPQPIEYANAPDEVRAVFDDIKATRNVPDVNNFWTVSYTHLTLPTIYSV